MRDITDERRLLRSSRRRPRMDAAEHRELTSPQQRCLSCEHAGEALHGAWTGACLLLCVM